MNLVFDYDGTLHDCSRIYLPAFREAYYRMQLEGLVPEGTWKDEEICSWLGYSSTEMWDSFMPGLPKWVKEKYSTFIGAQMEHLTAAGKAALYPGTLKMLRDMKEKGHTLLVLSNCKTKYMEQHRKYFHLDRYFQDYFPAEEYGYMEKWKIFPMIRSKYPGDYLVIGDRFHDMEIGERHGIKSVGCTYGYGREEELKMAWKLVGSIEELRKCIWEIGDRAK
jgi:phosphoglycolate phosphatase